jgi:hypothetical protein
MDPDGPGGERSCGPAEPVSADPPAGGSPAADWPRNGRGSGAGERAWPWFGDPPPLTREAADRLNPWGDHQPSATPTRRAETVTATTEAWPWADDQLTATPTRRAETTTATTEAWPWGNGDDASPGP